MEFQESISKEEQRARYEKKLAAEIVLDFEQRREARRSVESGWLLNMNFFSGNQYCDVSPFGGVVEEDKQFYWQARRAFNHIAPTVDSRIAKLEKLRPTLKVRAFSDEDGDVQAAKLATGILQYAQERIGFADVVSKATVWAEVCGSAFYKVVWEENGGRKVGTSEDGTPVYEGEIGVSALSPFEIYPDRLNAESIDDLASIIHAQVVSADYIFQKFGKAVQADSKSVTAEYSEQSSGKLPLQKAGMTTAPQIEDGVILIERYTKPTGEFPKGRLEIVAGNELLYEGDLPYQNGERGERVFPFVKQDSMRMPGAFFGGSVIDRLIPVQRAYNAVRNRKHEFLNRLSMGVLTVEDGSVDTDELTEEGLLPGKVLVYRQGGKAPEMLDCGKMPSEFSAEEAWLEKEFSLIGGISDLSQNSTPLQVTSATGLQLLLSQDESRLAPTIGSIERALKEIARQTLRLYRQFAGTARLMTMTGENKKVQVRYFNGADVISDVSFEMDTAATPEEKQATLLRLYEAGVLTDDDGKLTAESKNRILEAFGFGSYQNARDISALHIAKASEENLSLAEGGAELDADTGGSFGVQDYDDHALHLIEHTRFLLSAEYKKLRDKQSVSARFKAHMAEHTRLKNAGGVPAEEE